MQTGDACAVAAMWCSCCARVEYIRDEWALNFDIMPKMENLIEKFRCEIELKSFFFII